MARFNLFGKKLKGENQYFKTRKADAKDTNDQQPKSKGKSPPPPPPEPEKGLLSERLINRDLMIELLKAMRSHDINATIAVLSNTIDSAQRRAGIMLNKGFIPKRIVTYLQNITIWNIEDAFKLVRSEQPDTDGYYPVDEQTAARLNLPLGCMLLGIFHHIKKEFGVVLVVKTGLKDRKKFAEDIKKLIQR